MPMIYKELMYLEGPPTMFYGHQGGHGRGCPKQIRVACEYLVTLENKTIEPRSVSVVGWSPIDQPRMEQEVTTQKYSISAASRVANKGRATIARHLKSGRLSCEVAEDGAKLIDASELIRVYGNDCDFGQVDDQSAKTQRSEKEAEGGHFQKIEMQYEARLKQQEAEIDHLRGLLNTASGDFKHSLRLLEDQSNKADSWKTAVEGMEQKLSNQSSEKFLELEERYKKQMHRMKQELVAERSKSFFKRLLG